MNDLIVLETPLQLLNAVEAARSYRLVDARLVVLVTEAFSKRRFEALLESLPVVPWKVVRYVRLRTDFPYRDGPPGIAERLREYLTDFSRIANRVKLAPAISGGGEPDRVFVGNYLDVHKPYFRHVANAFPNSEVVLLDDGTDTITVAAQRLQYRRSNAGPAMAVPETAPSPLRRVARWIRRKAIDWDDTPRASVTFFSAFDVEVQAPDRRIRHTYEVLRTLSSTRPRSGELWILGQCLPEDHYVALNDYVDCVREIRRRTRAENTIYVPHPRESAETTGAIAALNGIEIRRFDIPVEFALLRAATLPKAVASFYCTALINISLIFGEMIDAQSYVLDRSTILRNHEQISSVYAAMRAMRIPSLSFVSGEGEPVRAGQTDVSLAGLT